MANVFQRIFFTLVFLFLSSTLLHLILDKWRNTFSQKSSVKTEKAEDEMYSHQLYNSASVPKEIYDMLHVASQNSLNLLIVDLQLTFARTHLTKNERLRFAVFAEQWKFVGKTVSALTDGINSRWRKISSSSTSCYHIYNEYSTTDYYIMKIKMQERYWLFHGIPGKLEDIAIKKQSLRKINLSTSVSAMVPIDIVEYTKELKSSRFLQCNEEAAKQYKEANKDLSEEDPWIPDSGLDDLDYLVTLFAQYGMRLMIASGTLLGWYRECGIIAHTYDLDTFAFISEYNKSILQNLAVNERVKLYWVLGKAEDSLELTVHSKQGITIDIFFLYSKNNSLWIGGMEPEQRLKLKWMYPIIPELCSVDLKGFLFHVPCNVEEYLVADYGKEWRKPY